MMRVWLVCLLLAVSAGIGSAASSGKSSTAAAPLMDITPKGEKGEPLEVSGVIYQADGRTPVAGAEVTFYHTDAAGHYSKGGQDRGHATFSGRIVTGSDGRYGFRTIRPGHYPGGQTPQHIHFGVVAKDGRTLSTEIRFADDPVVAQGERARAKEAARLGDRFYEVRTVERDARGVQLCTFDLKLPATD
jgi:protocatechuate 3,4-dioxygenase beta subunit